MNSEDAKRLDRLQAIAQIKADKAVARYAAVHAVAKELRQRLKRIDVDVQDTLKASTGFESSKIALAYAALKRKEKAALMAELARVETERKMCQLSAQHEEGRRIALEKLRDQAS